MGHTSRQHLRLLYHPTPAGARIRQRLTDSTPQQRPAESPLPTAVPRQENTSRRALPAITSGWPFRFPLRYNAPTVREADNSLAAAVGGHGFIDRFGMTINL